MVRVPDGGWLGASGGGGGSGRNVPLAWRVGNITVGMKSRSCGRPLCVTERAVPRLTDDGQLALTSSGKITVFDTEAPVESVDDHVTHSMNVFVHGRE